MGNLEKQSDNFEEKGISLEKEIIDLMGSWTKDKDLDPTQKEIKRLKFSDDMMGVYRRLIARNDVLQDINNENWSRKGGNNKLLDRYQLGIEIEKQTDLAINEMWQKQVHKEMPKGKMQIILGLIPGVNILNRAINLAKTNTKLLERSGKDRLRYLIKSSINHDSVDNERIEEEIHKFHESIKWQVMRNQKTGNNWIDNIREGKIDDKKLFNHCENYTLAVLNIAGKYLDNGKFGNNKEQYEMALNLLKACAVIDIRLEFESREKLDRWGKFIKKYESLIWQVQKLDKIFYGENDRQVVSDSAKYLATIALIKYTLGHVAQPYRAVAAGFTAARVSYLGLGALGRTDWYKKKAENVKAKIGLDINLDTRLTADQLDKNDKLDDKINNIAADNVMFVSRVQKAETRKKVVESLTKERLALILKNVEEGTDWMKLTDKQIEDRNKLVKEIVSKRETNDYKRKILTGAVGLGIAVFAFTSGTDAAHAQEMVDRKLELMQEHAGKLSSIYESHDGKVTWEGVKEYCDSHHIAYNEQTKIFVENNRHLLEDKNRMWDFLTHTGTSYDSHGEKITIVYDQTHLAGSFDHDFVTNDGIKIEGHSTVMENSFGQFWIFDQKGQHLASIEELYGMGISSSHFGLKEINDFTQHLGYVDYSPNVSSADNLWIAIQKNDLPAVDKYLANLQKAGVNGDRVVLGTNGQSFKNWLVENKAQLADNKKLFNWIVYRDSSHAKDILLAKDNPSFSAYAKLKDLHAYLYQTTVENHDQTASGVYQEQNNYYQPTENVAENIPSNNVSVQPQPTQGPVVNNVLKREENTGDNHLTTHQTSFNKPAIEDNGKLVDENSKLLSEDRVVYLGDNNHGTSVDKLGDYDSKLKSDVNEMMKVGGQDSDTMINTDNQVVYKGYEFKVSEEDAKALLESDKSFNEIVNELQKKTGESGEFDWSKQK